MKFIQARSRILAAILVASAAAEAHAACAVTDDVEWCFQQGSIVGSGTPERDDALGHAVAVGDYNGDGHLDLAVGAPGESEGGGIVNGDGALHVLYGDGVRPRAAGALYVESSHILGETPPGFATSLATVRANDDRFDDLVVGMPNADRFAPSSNCIGGDFCTEAGAVMLLLGSTSGLSSTGLEIDRRGPGRIPRAREHFGAALAQAQAPSRGWTLAVSAPEFSPPGIPDQGIVERLTLRDVRLNGSSLVDGEVRFESRFAGAGLGTRPHLGVRLAFGRFTDNTWRLVAGAPFDDPAPDSGSVHVELDTPVRLSMGDFVGFDQSDSQMGTAIAVGDFDRDGFDDLALGVHRASAGATGAGRVFVAAGAAAGLEPDASIQQSGFGGETDEEFDNFGFAVAAGDLNGDGFDDLVVGAPGEESGAADDETGFVYILEGSGTGTRLLQPSGDHFRQSDVGGTNGVGDRFGSVLATGDFDHDGVHEIVVGVPARDAAGKQDAGRVYIVGQFSTGGGADLAIVFSGTQTEIDPPATGRDTVTLQSSGPLARLDGARVSVSYPANTVIEGAGGSGWDCRVLSLLSETDVTCERRNALLRDVPSPTLAIDYLLPAGFSATRFRRDAIALSDIVDPDEADNARVLDAPVAQSGGLFADGFE